MNQKDLIEFLESNNHKTIFATLGIRVESYDPDNMTVAINVDKRHFQHVGLVHGGVFVTLAESAASMAAALKVSPFEYHVSGMEINANYLRPVTAGIVKAQATLIHHGKSTMVYNIDVTNNTNDGDKLVCVSRCTIAVKKRKS